MRIDIYTAKFSLTESLRNHVERRVQFALAYQNLGKVSFRLDDINGPKGGLDKSCRIQIPVAGAKPIVIEEVQSDIYIAIDRAIERAARALSRTLQRKRDHSQRRTMPAWLDESTFVSS
jgi:ribosomal subunit interface protein